MQFRSRVAAGVLILVGFSFATRGEKSNAHAQLQVAAACPTGFVRVPSGTFMMGSPATEGEPDEHPQHTLTLPGFCMERLEVTEAQYEACVAAGSCTAPGSDAMCNSQDPSRGNHPVNCVDWNQAIAYCNSIGARLPTEPEWEYAARGSDGRKYPWGNQPPNAHLLNACGGECASYAWTVHHETKVAMYSGNDGYAETAPVGSYPRGASPFGILDMAGNVYEWTSSPYCPYPKHACPTPYRMYRGGGWYTEKTTTVATRNGHLTTEKSVTVGIRCVK